MDHFHVLVIGGGSCGLALAQADAAHSMLPHRGQGLSHALMDASELVDAIVKLSRQEKTLQEVVGAYELEMRLRGAEEVDRSREQAESTASKTDASNFEKLKHSPLFSSGLHKL